LFHCGLVAAFDALAITTALPVAPGFSRRRRSVTLLCLPAGPVPRRAPAFLAAVALARPLRAETPFTSFQQTAARPRAAPWFCRRAGFLIVGWACRIFARAHGSVAPGSSGLGGDSSPLRGQQVRCSVNSRVYRRATGRRPVRLSVVSPALRAPFVSPSDQGALPTAE